MREKSDCAFLRIINSHTRGTVVGPGKAHDIAVRSCMGGRCLEEQLMSECYLKGSSLRGWEGRADSRQWAVLF